MTADSTGTASERSRANRMYWQSDDSVNAIADTLGVSKGRLYDLIEPLGAGVNCPECGGPLAYPNRTAREKGMVICDTCGFEGMRDEGEASGVRRIREALRNATGDREPLADAAVLGGILVGLSAGVVLYRWLRS